MAKNAKYYVVWVGATPGVYDDWKSCEAQIKGYPNALYKSFRTKAEADQAYRESAKLYVRDRTRSSSSNRPALIGAKAGSIIQESISVDAACSGNPGVMEYRGVRTGSGEELFHMGPFAEGTNNIGEFLAIVHALALLEKQGDETTSIYSDSKIAQGWVRDGKARTRLLRNAKNKSLFDLIARAESWLKTHKWKNPLVKWDTRNWGEIPADFGRK
jgi:ribonuclease HI